MPEEKNAHSGAKCHERYKCNSKMVPTNCLYFGTGHDLSFMKTQQLRTVSNFTCVDALPRLPHYLPEHAGYENNKDEPTFLRVLDEAVRRRGKVVATRIWSGTSS